MNLDAVHSSHHNDLFVPENERVDLSVRNLKVVFKKKDKKDWKQKLPGKNNDEEKQGTAVETGAPAKIILNDISLDLPKGQLLAILGASGSGKTTLLNTLSSRMSFAKNSSNPFQFEGLVQYSQRNPNVSYLLQEDLFMPGLSVRETLKFTAQLKLPNSSNQEIDSLIDYLFEALDLKKIENTMINDFKYKCTLSGGEQRRVSLAIQLLTKPSVLFLDEPTTGLDANTSIHLVQTVKDLAANFGITVIMTIHQPRSEILEIVDQLCLLAKGGSMLFMGSLNESQSYFEQTNYITRQIKVEDDANFADFLLKVSAIDQTVSKEVEMEARERVNKLVSHWRSHQSLKSNIEYSNTFESGQPIFNQNKTNKPSFIKEVRILMHRCYVLTIRDGQSMITLHGIMIMLSIILGYAFYKPGGDLGGIRSITSSLYICCEVLGFTPLIYEIERLAATDGRFLVRDSKEGVHSITGFLLARKLVKLVLEDIPIAIVWSLITYFMWGLNETSNFGIFFINNLLILGVGMGTALLCFMLGKYQFGAANLIVNYFYQLQNSACGYFVNAKTMPVYVRWTKYLANFWYAFGSLVSNSFSDYTGDCPYEPGSSECYEYTGEYVLKNLGYPKSWYATPIVVNIAWMLFFNIASGTLLWFQSRRKTVRTVKPILPKTKSLFNSGVQSNKEILTKVYSSKFIGEIFVNLKDIRLTLKPSFMKNTVLRKPYDAKQLLKGVTCTFKPGVNAIMGPSGSGKTTLLNFVTGRTQKSTISAKGDVLLNQDEIPFDLLKKITTYVVQNDNVLIPTLTVRETLYYQARLRLDVSRYPYIPVIVTDLIRKIGLTDVADIPIGDAHTKGISGGEKRRVSIAIQLLNDSKILLLDEPTSGLDSFTSSSIIALLNELAITEGKTIILTIHQPKFEIFQKFDNVLLLANGSVIYDGAPLDMIEYFDSMGLRPEPEMNFADYMLDVISNRSENGPETAAKMIANWTKVDKGEFTEDTIPVSEDKANKEYDLDQYKTLIKKPHILKVAFQPILERQFKVILRSPNVFFCRFGQIAGLSVIHALYFSPMRNDSESVLNRLGLIQQVTVLYFVGMLSNVTVFPIEKSTFYQEYEDNTYNPLTFMICYLINELPFELITSFIFAIFTVLVVGLPRNGGMFFTMFYMCFGILNSGESFGMMFTSLFDHLGIAVNFVANLQVAGVFLAGTMSINVPVLYKAFNYISPLKYVVLALADLVFTGQKFDCPEGIDTCSLQTGEQVLDQYKFNSKLFTNYVALAAILILYRLVAYGIFEFKVRVLRK
ncbi:Pleiotropic drug resistance protein [Wickerhamomyces ciferrii]|uniref:Pleiotropic drug resistance protein n=1 Tax=Wickerhamomyces ciferrii (strain ATCC 14091 / BCRC 22168 / CBS 111 / JCM 3599 / NBRC 0793 / NRRL Y-1031 F-60-10) TaxID=1206466 RepID=K0KTP9_WICCF|nr:Pleiotropic drug resistance protein [Wickerhamomyces ciferrii]CCH46551.1 Pleiotropic drug resistance protein [Wickerhamomyces ciferrii]